MRASKQPDAVESSDEFLDAASVALDDLRNVFALLRDVQSLGEQPFLWRAHAIRKLCHFTDSAHGWISQEKGAGSDRRILSLACADDSPGELHQCECDHHPPITAILRKPPIVRQQKSSCQIAKFLNQIKAKCNTAIVSIGFPEQGQTISIGVCRSLSNPPFEPRQQRILRLFAVELAYKIRGIGAGVLLDPINVFTSRQREVIDLLDKGKTERQAADLLGISRHTVHRFVIDIYRKLNVSSRGEFLAMMATMPRSKALKISLDWPDHAPA